MIKNFLPLSHERLSSAPPETGAELERISLQAEVDLAPPGAGHWSENDWKDILKRADEELASRLPVARPEQLREAWAQVATKFHREGNWGFHPQARRRDKPLTEGQKRFREMAPYLWAFVQSTLIIKFAIYYFGIQSADDPSIFNLAGLIICLALSFCSLVFFAWRMHRKEKNAQEN